MRVLKRGSLATHMHIKSSSRLARSQFLRHMATIAGGSAAGQLIVLAATPFLSRIYSPAQFGEYAVFLAVCNVFVAVACLRYDAALNASADNQIVRVFIVACLAAAVTAALVLVLVSSKWGEELFRRAVGAQLNPSWIAAAALICGIYQATSTFAIRRGQFAWSSILRAGQPAMFSVAAITLPIGLVGSCLLGFLTALPVAAKFISGLRPADMRDVISEAWRLREFPLMSLPTSILDTVSLAIPIWYISSHYSPMDAGNYAQAQRLLAAPLMLFALAVGQVFMKRAGDIIRAGQSVRGFQRRVVISLAVATCVGLVCVGLFGSPALSLLLGSHWRTDTAFLLLVFAPVAVRCCVSPVTGIFILQRRLRICAIWQTFYFLVTSGLFWTFAGDVSLEHLLVVYVGSEFFCYVVYLHLADRVAL
ncbi:O-antigen/teichoic acid export membrane protein [Bradyrhizobium sp. USDA 4509]|uniref:Membrane protein involved in the export of O-antigen and teichoic acid n=2 Tax=Bradyrhizobium brasilense TaxID=1419277 RepID=A0A1G7MA67_9BRAD|nr:Membrane protein involved in the export of O-antigen and teichoic acid [Bradyrhizobium brasilense]